MPYVGLKLRPGIDTEQTPLLNSAGYSFGSAIRFRAGLPEKTGGFQHLNNTKLIGTCTGLHAWATLDGSPYIAAGTEQRLELFYGGTIFDITPIRKTVNPAPAFTTVITSKTVTVHDVGHGAEATDWINIIVPVSVGGIILQGYYQIQTIIDADNYTILAATAATSSVVTGGAVPQFTTAAASPDVTVLFNNHGLIVNNPFTVQVSTVVSTFTLSGLYTVTAIVDGNHFKFQPGGVAGGNATVSENSGNTQIQYLIPSGLASTETVAAGGGYGSGPYGAGPYGVTASGSIIVPLRQWSLDNFGQDLVGNYNGSPIYVWVPPTTSTPAIPIDVAHFPGANNPPTQVNYSFVAAPQQMIVALGCNEIGSSTFDPLLVRWCDSGDFTDWFASSTNLAGSFRVPSGSMLKGGISASNFACLWTDIDMWLMSYLGGSGLVWGFNKIASGVDLLAARSCGVYQNVVYWPSSNGFFSFDGSSIRMIPCSVWDKFWYNLDRMQVDKVTVAVNSWFQEISWNFPSLDGDGDVDSRITYNVREGTWTYDDNPTFLARTAFIDDNVYGSPIGTDLNGYLQQQDGDGVYDADGAPMPASIRSGWFGISEGSLYTMIERIAGDLIVSGGDSTVNLTVYVQDYPTGPVTTYGPYNWNPTNGPPWSIVRARGRFASIQVTSTGLGVFWRLGDVRYVATRAGRR